MKKAKRVWSDEQRQAAAERMAARWSAKKLAQSVSVTTGPLISSREMNVEFEKYTPIPVIEGEMVAMVTTMEKPEDIQTGSALKLLAEEVSPTVRDAARVGSHEVTLLVRTDGTMVSQYGPCVCGARKREWHKICLKEAAHAT